MQDLEAIEEHRLAVIQELGDLEREREREANRLRRRARQTILRINFSQLEEGYARVKEIHDRFTSKREDWIKLLGTNKDGEPTFPQSGMPESRYNPENQDLARRTSAIEDILTSARQALANFIISLPAHKQRYIVQEAILPFHKNLEDIKAYCDAQVIDNGQNMEDTDANGLGEAATGNPEEQDHQGENNNVPSPRNSPRNSSTSSKTVKIEGKTYQVRKQRINRMLQDIEENASQNHSKHLEKQATLLSNLLNKMNIRHLTAYADTEPDFLEIFGETEDQMNDWKDEIEARIEDLIIRASREVSERKAATQSGFKKLSYPHFNGDILNYLEFKKQWAAEVVPERKPQAIELVALRDSIPASAKAKIADVTTMDKAWRMLDLEYGDI